MFIKTRTKHASKGGIELAGRTTHAERGEKERRDSGRNRVSGQGKIFGRIELNDEKNFEKNIFSMRFNW